MFKALNDIEYDTTLTLKKDNIVKNFIDTDRLINLNKLRRFTE